MPKLSERPLLERGFRPFFLLAALYAVASTALWGGYYTGYVLPPQGLLEPVAWHAHEMIYGFTMAVIAGFLLTAVANWTGGAPVRQWHLAGLCALWLFGRLVMALDMGLPLWLIYTFSTAFIPALALSLAIPLLRSWNKRNFIFLALLAILFACQIWFLLTRIMLPLHIAIMVVISIISLVGGRIIPAFTVAALRRRGIEARQTDQRKMDVAALGSLLLLILLLPITGVQGKLFAGTALLSALIHLWRMRFYHLPQAMHDPMLWILHLGYLWVIIGLIALALAALGQIGFSLALHILTTGAIGSMTLGMMCRVTLGHTGREIMASSGTIAAFILIQLAACIRILGPILLPEHIIAWIAVSASLWVASFTLYLLIYIPMLLTPRPRR